MMEDPTCQMQYYHASGAADHQGEDDSVLEESVSFGRFASESLDWEKWSSFSNNRYLEEVEKYSTPGSVAQKKAYFEAHYNKIATKKSATLLEQATTYPTSEDGPHCASPEAVEKQLADHSACPPVNETEKRDGVSPENAICAEHSFSEKLHDVALLEVGGRVSENNISVKSQQQAEPPNHLCYAESQNHAAVFQCDNTGEMDKLGGEEKKYRAAVLQSSLPTSASSSLPSPSQSSGSSRSINMAASKSGKSTSNLKEKRGLTPKSLHMSVSFSSQLASEISPAPANKRDYPSLEMSRVPKTPSSSSRSRNMVASKYEITSTNIKEKRGMTPKALHMSVNFSKQLAPEISCTPVNKRVSPSFEKSWIQKTPASSSQLTSQCLNAQESKTPLVLNTSHFKAPKKLTVIPPQDNVRIKTAVGCKSGRDRISDKKWKSFSVSHSASLVETANNGSTLAESLSFTLRSEQRAEKRKEYFMKLEEKINAREARRTQFEANSKEQADNDLKILRQSLVFKARPMPDFYHESGPQKNQIKKIPVTTPRSPKLGRKPSSKTGLDRSPFPLPRHSDKNCILKHKMGKKAYENTSPNIQS